MLPFLLLLISISAILYWISTYKFNYWKKQNVPYIKPTPVLGNYGQYICLKSFLGDVTQTICKQFPEQPYVGAFYGTEPTLIVQDPEIIKLVTTKDFYYFNSRENSDHNHKEVTTQNLFFSNGDQWKAVRQNLTPLFSSAKMKNMFPLIVNCSNAFEEFLDQKYNSSDIIEIRSTMTRFTMACICSCAFGADVDTLNQDCTDNEFLHIGRLIFLASTLRGIMNVTRAIWPAIFYAFGLKNFPDEMVNFFKYFASDVFKARDYKPTSRNDFIDLLLNLRNNKVLSADSIANMKTNKEDKIELEITDDLLLAQCVLFFAAGFETSATTSSYVLYELAKKPSVQEKVLEEVDSFLAKNGNRLTFSCMTDLPLTMACIEEAMRIHPILAVITREVIEDYTLPTGVILHKGVRVHIPVYHMHHSAKYFPDPEEFMPERFLPENRSNVIPHTYMPFGDGPRICIGMRFAKMQMLAGLVTVLKKFRLETTESTPSKLVYEPRSIVTVPTQELNLRLVIRDDWETRLFVRTSQ